MMLFSLTLHGETYPLAPPVDISIPLIFNGPQPSTYGVPIASSKPYEGGGFVGDVRQGSGCNFEEYTFVPHCNGTHTECVGHITTERLSVHDCLRESFVPATLVTIAPKTATHSHDGYEPALDPSDLLIDKALLAEALGDWADTPVFLKALVVRTTPNSPFKRARNYMELHPAFFTLDAMEYLVEMGVMHLLVDMPSVDRLFDEGKLSAHHIFWNMPQGTHTVTPEVRIHATITELIYVPDEIPDGNYVVEMQIAPFVSDAAPSRPRLWALT